MRIAQLIDSLASGGAERLQVTFAETALERGIRPTVIALANYPNTPIPEQLRATGVDMIEFIGRNLVDPLRFLRLTRYLIRERFDILHAHLGYAIILGVCAGWLSGTPVVATIHNIQSDRWKYLETFLLWLGAKRVIAVGETVADVYKRKLPGKRIEVVVNPVKPVPDISPSERDAIREEITNDTSRPLLTSVGRLESQKGYRDLICSMDIIRKSYPRAFLAIVGTGMLKEELQKQINDLDLQDHVSLLGIRRDVPQVLASSDLFVSSSHWEGMPIAMLEAMSAGLAIVATSVGDVPNIVNLSCGLLVEPKQPDQLAKAIVSVLKDPHRRLAMGRAAREYIGKEHDTGRWLDSLLSIYSEISRQ